MTKGNSIRFPDVDEGIYVPVGALLRRVRDLRGLNQQNAAELICVPGSTLSALEAGRRTIRSVPMSMRVADGLNIPRHQMIEWVILEVEHHHPDLRRQK